MKRRGFFTAIAGLIFVKLPALAKVTGIQAPFSDQLEWLTPEDPRSNNGKYHAIYKGYKIFWTGWKGSPYSIDVVAQWIAYHKGIYNGTSIPNAGAIYASFPGGESTFSRGHCFDISLSAEQYEMTKTIDWFMHDDIVDRAKEITLGRLLKLIDAKGIKEQEFTAVSDPKYRFGFGTFKRNLIVGRNNDNYQSWLRGK